MDHVEIVSVTRTIQLSDNKTFTLTSDENAVSIRNNNGHEVFMPKRIFQMLLGERNGEHK